MKARPVVEWAPAAALELANHAAAVSAHHLTVAQFHSVLCTINTQFTRNLQHVWTMVVKILSDFSKVTLNTITSDNWAPIG